MVRVECSRHRRDLNLMRFLSLSSDLSSRDIAVDPGTVNTVVCAHRGELVLTAPSIVAVDPRSGATLAAGTEALELVALRRDRAHPTADGWGDHRPTQAADMLRCLIGNVHPPRATPAPRGCLRARGRQRGQRRAVL